MSGDPDGSETDTVRLRSHHIYLGYLKLALRCVHGPSLNEHS